MLMNLSKDCLKTGINKQLTKPLFSGFSFMEERKQRMAMKQYAYTQMLDIQGAIIPARIALATGEIKPYKKRKKRRIEAVGTINEDCGKPLHWEMITPPIRGGMIVSAASRDKRRRTRSNENNIYLKEYHTVTDALEEIPALDDMLTGASYLHDGTKPFSKSLLFCMLRDLDTITTETVKDYTGFNERHSRKLASALRVLINAFNDAVDG